MIVPTCLCPICKRPWEPVPEIVFDGVVVYFAGQKLPLEPNSVKIFRVLFDNLGRSVPHHTLYNTLYPVEHDNPGIPDNVKIHIAKVRAMLNRYSVPLAIPRGESGGGYSLIAR